MTAVLIFTEIAIAGCAFLIYFMVALWRDSHRSRNGSRVNIRRLAPRRKEGKVVLYLHSLDEFRQREKKRM
jgi:threonine/homoserine/homoserine lactone efflux protein